MSYSFSSTDIDPPEEDSFDNDEYEDYIARISDISEALSTGDIDTIAQTLESSSRDHIWAAISPFSADDHFDASFQGDEKQFEAVINGMREQGTLGNDPSWDKFADDVVDRWMNSGAFEEEGWWPDFYDEETGTWLSQPPVLRQPDPPRPDYMPDEDDYAEPESSGGIFSRIGRALSGLRDDARAAAPAKNPFGGDPMVSGGQGHEGKPMVASYDYVNKNGTHVHVDSYKNPRYRGPRR